MNRFELLNDIFSTRCLFKVVCGAGNEDPVEVMRLSQIYTLAGAEMIDISANETIVHACLEGIQRAFDMSPSLGISLKHRPFINVSVGLKGDPHVRKAVIDPDVCIECGQCRTACEQQAIDETFTVVAKRCIGCGYCEKNCPANAVSFNHTRVDFTELLPKLLSSGVDNLELHATIADDTSVYEDWRLLNTLAPNNFISLCIDRTNLSNTHYMDRVRKAYAIAGERTIIQADGDPMSGGSDDFNTTLPAISAAEVTAKSGVPVKILASGGTNSKTKELADLCGVKIHGVSIGTYARKLVRHLTAREDFDSSPECLKQAVEIAQRLVTATTKQY